MPKSPARKMYVLDTSVLLADPNAIVKFAEHEVVIPLVVIKELEGKRNDALLGYPAREALRGIEAQSDLGKTRGEDIRTGVTVTDEGGTLRVEVNHIDQSGLPDGLAQDRTHDTRILAVAKNLAKDGNDVAVVSKDLPLRLLAETVGLAAEAYRNEQVVVKERYTGLAEIDVDPSALDDLYASRSLDICDVSTELADLPVNTGVRLLSHRGSALGIIRADKTIEVIHNAPDAFGIKGRSAEQKVALAHLLNPEVGVVSLGGVAGSGKTALAMAAGLEQVMEQRAYGKIIVFRPMYAVGGQELGFLPGTAEEKMAPWGAAISDALEGITTKEVIDEVIAQGLVEVLPLTHIRGRTLHNAFVIVDEAQSLEKPVLLTALTRLGSDSKIVLTHDVAQRDNLRVGRHDGIQAVVERLKGEPLFAHVTFTKSERSAVAEMATRLLDWGL
jgi:PhoH-like ATPase